MSATIATCASFYGSALDRLLADNALRARIGKQVSGVNLHDL